MKRLLAFAVVLTMVAAPAAFADSTPVMADYTLDYLDGGSGQATRGTTVYDPQDYNAISTPHLWDGDQYEVDWPGPYVMDGFGFGWGELIEAGTGLPHGGTVTVSFFDWDPVYLPDLANPLAEFTFGITTHTEAEYPGYAGYFLTTMATYDIPDPADYVTFASAQLWMGYEFSDPDLGYWTIMHADDDLTGDIGTNMDNPLWYALATDGWHHYWFGGAPNGDMYGVINMIPEPASFALLALGGLALIRRRR